MLSLMLGAASDTRDPIFDLTPLELFLGIIVVFVICVVVGWAWRTFKP